MNKSSLIMGGLFVGMQLACIPASLVRVPQSESFTQEYILIAKMEDDEKTADDEVDPGEVLRQHLGFLIGEDMVELLAWEYKKRYDGDNGDDKNVLGVEQMYAAFGDGTIHMDGSIVFVVSIDPANKKDGFYLNGWGTYLVVHETFRWTMGLGQFHIVDKGPYSIEELRRKKYLDVTVEHQFAAFPSGETWKDNRRFYCASSGAVECRDECKRNLPRCEDEDSKCALALEIECRDRCDAERDARLDITNDMKAQACNFEPLDPPGALANRQFNYRIYFKFLDREKKKRKNWVSIDYDRGHLIGVKGEPLGCANFAEPSGGAKIINFWGRRLVRTYEEKGGEGKEKKQKEKGGEEKEKKQKEKGPEGEEGIVAERNGDEGKGVWGELEDDELKDLCKDFEPNTPGW